MYCFLIKYNYITGPAQNENSCIPSDVDGQRNCKY